MARPDPEVADTIRDAATVILIRDAGTAPAVLMGQRGKTAAFLPDKFVFPGGAVDPEDSAVNLPETLPHPCRARLAARSDGLSPETLALAAIRELWEEAGLRLGQKRTWAPPVAWTGFAEGGHAPDISALRFFFRAITPPGRPRRFDARFFLADADRLAGDPDDFSAAEDELSHLAWVPLTDVRQLNLPFITRIVLAELDQHLPSLDAPARVPFITNDQIDNTVIWL